MKKDFTKTSLLNDECLADRDGTDRRGKSSLAVGKKTHSNKETGEMVEYFGQVSDPQRIPQIVKMIAQTYIGFVNVNREVRFKEPNAFRKL